MRNAIQAANGDLANALELLLNNQESPTDVYSNEVDFDDDDVQIVQHDDMKGSKRPRHVVDDSIIFDDGMDDIFSTGHAHGIGHIFVDHSNLSLAEADIPAFDCIASNGLSSFHERVVVGSQTEAPGHGRVERAWKALGYTAHFQQKLAHQSESFVDESLIAHVQRAVLQHSPEGRTIVLATGEFVSVSIQYFLHRCVSIPRITFYRRR